MTKLETTIEELEQIRADVEAIKARLILDQDIGAGEIVGDPVDYCPNCGYEITPGMKSSEYGVCD